MDISEILPRTEIQDRVDGKYKITETRSFRKINDLKKSSVFEIGSTVWDRHVSAPDCPHSPKHFSSYFDNRSPGLIRAIERLLEKELMHNLYYSKFEIKDPSLPYKTISELLACELWPGTLHISDVEFSNPRILIPAGSGLPQQKCKGLGLFPTLLERAEVYCRERNLGSISLTAATRPHFAYFQRHGFSAANTKAGKVEQGVGLGIPMIRKI